MFKRFFAIFIIPLCCCLQGHAQKRVIDSLKNVLKKEQDDTNKVNTLNVLAGYLYTTNPDTTILLAQQTATLAIKLGWTKGEAYAYSNTAIGYYMQGHYPQALDYFMKALKIAQDLGYKKIQTRYLNNIGLVYNAQGDYTNALDYDLKALKMEEELGDIRVQASTLGNIGLLYTAQDDYPKALDYLFKSLKMAEEHGYKHLEASTLGYIGMTYSYQKDLQKSLTYDMEALKMAQDLGDKSVTSINLGNIGDAYENLHKYSLALDYYSRALKMNKELGSKHGQAINLGNMGSVETKTGKFIEAEASLKNAIALDDSLKDLNYLRQFEELIAHLYDTTKRYELALTYYKKATALKDTLFNQDKNKALTRKELTYQYEKKEAVEKADQDKKDVMVDADKRKQQTITNIVGGGLLLMLLFSGLIFRSLRITRKQKQVIEIKNKETEDQRKVIELVGQIGQKITSSLNLGEVIETIHGNISSVMDAPGLIIYIYNEEKECLDLKYVLGKHEGVIAHSIPLNSKESFCVYSFNNKKEILVNDVSKEYSKYISSYYWASVPDTEIISAFINIPLIVGDRTIGVISVQSFKTNVYTKEHLEILKSLGSFMSVALNNADAYTQLNAAKENLTKQKALVDEKNKDILDSINYAKRLQDAILPPVSIIKKYLPESFVLYKPKAIIAGDFYWMEQEGDTILIAAADCTGHGVPGALVSVICSNALNRTVKEFHIKEPGKILDKVRELVLETFEKSESNVQDGMDISLCSINTNTREIQWSGAYNSLLYIQHGELHEVLADKQPIGKTDLAQPFNTHAVKLQKGDTIYLFTDGYADQFGGPKRKKFKYKQMEELLLANAKKRMEEQKNILESTLDEWKGNLEQVDDILVIGIEV